MARTKVLRIAFLIRQKKAGFGKQTAYGVLSHHLNEMHIGLFGENEMIALVGTLTGQGLSNLEMALDKINATYQRVIVKMDKVYPYCRECFLPKDAHLKIVQKEWG